MPLKLRCAFYLQSKRKAQPETSNPEFCVCTTWLIQLLRQRYPLLSWAFIPVEKQDRLQQMLRSEWDKRPGSGEQMVMKWCGMQGLTSRRDSGYERRRSGGLQINLDHLGTFNVCLHPIAYGRLLSFASIKMQAPRTGLNPGPPGPPAQ